MEDHTPHHQLRTNASGIARKSVAVVFLVCAMLIGGLHTAPQPLHASELTDQINGINKEVEQKKRERDSVIRKIDQYRKSIEQKKLETASLEDAMSLLENQIAQKFLDIDIATREIEAADLAVEEINGKIELQETRLEQQRVSLATLTRRLYQKGYKKSPLEILATHDTFSAFFDDLHGVLTLEKNVRDQAEAIKLTKAALNKEREDKKTHQLAEEENKRQLELAKASLEEQRQFKNSLLIDSQQSELKYRYLLAELKREQTDANDEILNLEASLRDKISLADRLKGQGTILSWPVSSAKGISTMFHDPSYPFRNVYEHPGLDIRAGQGTPVRASAAGVIARAKDAGMGYSYVLIMHNNSIATVYGHLSRIIVKEDTFVERGEVIGYSGGMPRTPGAGTMTTGPHLHFETRVSGIPNDPLKYLMASSGNIAGNN